MRRGQAAVLLAAAALPALALAMVALACLGARARAEHAQRLADAAALRAAVGLPTAPERGTRLEIARAGRDVVATVTLRALRLRVPLVEGAIAYPVAARAVARAATTAEGRPGAVIVG